jgi:dihydrofolate reductase
MIISLIAAMDLDRAIGRENRLPWHLPKDLERFRTLTVGHPVIMGRKTFESIGRTLPGRTNIIITRQEAFSAEGAVIVHDLQTAFAECGDADEVFVLGGAEIFREAMPFADRIYLTIVHTRIQGDAFFPELPPVFSLIKSEPADDVFQIDFAVYERTHGRAADSSFGQ